MKMTRVITGAAFSALVLVGLATGGAAQELAKPQVIAVQVFAEWCEPCLDMEEAAGFLADRFDGDAILGIVLDVTNLSTRYHAEMLASALDLDALYRQKMGTLGEIYLLDAESKSLLDTITVADDFDTMSAKVRNALVSQ